MTKAVSQNYIDGQTKIWEEWGGTIFHELKQDTEENSYWRQQRYTKIGNTFSDKHELYV